MLAEQETGSSAWVWRQRALACWENEGGALGVGRDGLSATDADRCESLPLADAELVQLRIRVIALENLVIALLAEASERQLRIAREMARYIAPRPGFTQHELTVRAEGHMLDLVERAARFDPGDAHD